MGRCSLKIEINKNLLGFDENGGILQTCLIFKFCLFQGSKKFFNVIKNSLPELAFRCYNTFLNLTRFLQTPSRCVQKNHVLFLHIVNDINLSEFADLRQKCEGQ